MLPPTRIFAVLIFLLPAPAAFAQWREVDVPGIWKRPPREIDNSGGFGWYRCRLNAPKDWEGEDLTLIAESADDARQYFLNGQLLGQSGNFPPTYRSGLGEIVRLRVESRFIRPGAENVLAIRVCQQASRTNFNVAPPVLVSQKQREGIRLRGKWELRAGDPAANVVSQEPLKTTLFEKVEPAEQLEKSSRKLDNDAGPLAPADSLATFTIPNDLIGEVALAEPHVRQPLSIKWDERGRMWVMQYLQYPNPAGLKMVSRDKYLRSVYDKTPPAPPNHFRGADKITIHEDTDGDGKFDKHKTFVEGLSLATSFARGRGGLFVLNPPYLLFYPDADGDDVPDDDPQVLLQGFGIEDSHSVTNNLRWGPDGWLYASQGSTVTGAVRRPDQPETEAVHSMGQLIWRYHPEQKKYEIFAEGGGNAFGVEIDEKGRIYSGHNGGDTRGFHYVQGGYYRKGFGKHGSLSNPHAYGYFANMAHHKVTRFTHTFVIYDGGALPDAYQRRLFGVSPLLSHVVISDVQADRSSYKTNDVGYVINAKDPWFRPVDIQVGPDGALYVVDMYEQRIDHSSHYQGRIHRTSGRIFRVRGKDSTSGVAPFNLGELSSSQLVEKLDDRNKWTRQTVLRLLGDRRDAALIPALKARLAESDGQRALETLWALHQSGGFNDDVADASLEHADRQVRAWTVRLLGDSRQVSGRIAEHLAELAYREPDVQVRSQLACSARRLSAAQGLPIVSNLLKRSEDVGDIHLPLLLWWAIEDNVDVDGEQVLAMLQKAEAWKLPMIREHIAQRLMRRLSSSGSRRDLLLAAQLLKQSPSSDDSKRLVAGFEQAFEGRALTGLPDELTEALAAAGGGSLALQLRQGDPAAIKKALAQIEDAKLAANKRIALIEVVGQTKLDAGRDLLLKLLGRNEPEGVRLAILYALQSFADEPIGEGITDKLAKLTRDSQEAALAVLASRAAWSRALLKQVQAGKINQEIIPMHFARRALLHGDDKIDKLVGEIWGDIDSATADVRAALQRYGQVLSIGSGNPYNGEKLFMSSCGKCHKLFADGGKIGPDLTSYKRDDQQRMLVNIVNPSIEIREGYENHAVLTEDGRALNGFIEDEDAQVLILKAADGQRTIIPLNEIEDRRRMPTSIMPSGLLDKYSDQQIRDLFAYLRSTQPLP